jgi:hypothetical protein
MDQAIEKEELKAILSTFEENKYQIHDLKTRNQEIPFLPMSIWNYLLKCHYRKYMIYAIKLKSYYPTNFPASL